MENNSSEIKINQEGRLEIRLSPEVVRRIYDETIMRDGEYGKRKYVYDLINDVVFNEERLEKKRNNIEKLADQLQPHFFTKETNGADSRYAINDKYQNCWDSKGENYKLLLALISAIGLGKVSTSREYLNRVRIKDKSTIYYLIDKTGYLKELARQKYVNGGRTL